MTWDELNSTVYAEYERRGTDAEVDIFGYDVKLHDVLGSDVGSVEIDDDAQAIILKYGSCA